MFTDKPNSITMKIVLIYVSVGAAWIFISDKILSLLVQEKEMVTFFSLIKGCLYVIITGILVYFLISKSIKAIKKAEQELKQGYDAFSEANIKLEAANQRLAESQKELEEQYRQTLINQKKIQESEERYRLISEATNDALWQEVNGVSIFSDRWYEITGYSKADLETAEDGWESFIHPEDRAAVRDSMLNHKSHQTPCYNCEYRFRRKDGKYIWIYARGKAYTDDKGELCNMAGSYTDITELKEYEHRLHHLAYHDQLTGLKNRFALNEKLNFLISLHSKEKFALLHIDVDNFKYINDTMGHKTGDTLLHKISERLMENRTYNSTVYRTGGDEFIVLVERYTRIEQLEKMAVNILKVFKPCFIFGNMNIFTTVSVGISTYPEHGDDADELLKNADIAVHKAKEAGRNRVVFFNTPMNEEMTERMIIEKHLRKALDNNEFELYYQPQLDISQGAISGFEALLRWKNSELGTVSPMKFISIAEATQLIIPIGEWVLKEACRFLSNLEKMGNKGFKISVNISMLQLLQDDFAHMVIDTIETAGLDPRQVELEITESILMESYEVIAGKLKLLRARGVGIALDDFGKGYSSLNYLKNLPITTLKVDKSFIDTISSSSKERSLTDLIVKMGRAMDLCVVAEGVETQEQMDYLIRHKCHKVQGYLIGKPIQEVDIIEKAQENFKTNYQEVVNL